MRLGAVTIIFVNSIIRQSQLYKLEQSSNCCPANIYLFKVNNKNTRTTSLTSFWCFYFNF